MMTLIVAMSKNNIIGINNSLPWHITEDLKNFKNLTMGHPIIMGRKTYESIGKVLPRRQNLIVTRTDNYKVKGGLVFYSLESAISFCKRKEEFFIIGGGEIYKQSLPLADVLYVTEVQEKIEGDTYFPEIDPKEWKEISRDIKHQVDPNLEYHFVKYLRK